MISSNSNNETNQDTNKEIIFQIKITLNILGNERNSLESELTEKNNNKILYYLFSELLLP